MTATSSRDQSSTPVEWILFGSFLVTQLVLAAVGVWVAPEEGGDPEVYTVLAAVFALVSVTQLGLLAGLLPRVLGAANYQTFVIVRFALGEAIGIFGLVLAQLGAPLVWCGGFWLVGVVAILLGAPTQKDREAFSRLPGRASTEDSTK